VFSVTCSSIMKYDVVYEYCRRYHYTCWKSGATFVVSGRRRPWLFVRTTDSWTFGAKLRLPASYSHVPVPSGCISGVFLSQEIMNSGHYDMSDKPLCYSSARQTVFSSRIVYMWNNLPTKSADFSSLRTFGKLISSIYLLNVCKVNVQ